MSEAREGTRAVVMERELLHAPETVWRALTERLLLAEWLMPNDFEPVPGRSFQFRADPLPQWDGVIACEVTVVEPLRRLQYTWNALGLESVVMWTLTPTEAGTHPRMEHAGFRPEQETAFRGAGYGWQRILGRLDAVLAGAQ